MALLETTPKLKKIMAQALSAAFSEEDPAEILSDDMIQGFCEACVERGGKNSRDNDTDSESEPETSIITRTAKRISRVLRCTGHRQRG